LIDLARLDPKLLSTEPYEWAFIDGLFEPQDTAELATFFPHDNFRTVRGYDGEKGYSYEARSLIRMGADVPSHVEHLSTAWLRLADELLSPAYRAALARLAGRELDSLLMEANVFHYGPGAWLGPHVDLREKILTHVFYFNETWDSTDGGCLTILRSPDVFSEAFRVAPVAGNSVVLVRSGRSWHAVSPVSKGCRCSRRSLTVAFHSPGSVSTLWPPGVETPLHHYDGTISVETSNGMPGPLTRLRRRATYLIRATAKERRRR
jgi:Rps23 Pro-64 3,4-dihydroxylase Tpa1-like proline 4-hydroxylase